MQVPLKNTSLNPSRSRSPAGAKSVAPLIGGDAPFGSRTAKVVRRAAAFCP